MALLPNYYKFFAAGLGTPYARRWVPAPPYRGLVKMVEQSPNRNLSFWHIQVRVLGEAYVSTDVVEAWIENLDATNPPLVGSTGVALDEYSNLQAVDEVSVLSGLSRSSTSILKVRLRWKDWVGEREIDFDLGAGVDIISPPAYWVEAQLLLPVAGSELALPREVSENPLGFATSVIARADCVMNAVERNFNLTFTDTVYLDRAVTGDQVLIPRRPATNRFELTGTGAPLGTTTAVWDRNPPGMGPDLFGRLALGTTLPIPAGTVGGPTRGVQTQGRMAIPGAANAFFHILDNTVDTATISLIQELSF